MRPFSGLDASALHDILRLRVDVFVVEQHCPYPELDGLDPVALHVIGRHVGGPLTAYARILPPGADGLPHVGRVVVAKADRGRGLGNYLMEQVLQALQGQYGGMRSALAAQAHLQVFYETHGFARTGAPYLLDGIPHVDMAREA